MYIQPDPLTIWRKRIDDDKYGYVPLEKKKMPYNEAEMRKVLNSFLGAVDSGRSKLELVTKIASSVVYEDGDNKVTIRLSIPGIDRDSLRMTISDEQIHFHYKVKDLKTNELSEEKYYRENLEVANKKITKTSASYIDGIVEVIIKLETDKDAVLEVKLS